MHSKLFSKIIGILLLIVRFVKNSGQTIIPIIRKNKPILMFLINPSFTGTYLKPSQHLRLRSNVAKLMLQRTPFQESRES